MSWTARFPNILAVVGPELDTKVAALEADFRNERPKLAEPRRLHSRGFWNSALMVAFGDGDPVAEASRFRFEVIERGLEQAARVGKAGKFRAALTRDDDGFHQVIAELHLLGRLGPQFPTVDIERSGSKPGKNYDLHLEDAAGLQLHLDSKWRTATPLGEVNLGGTLNVEALLSREFSAFCFAVLRKNRLSDEDALRLALLIDDARRAIEEGRAADKLTFDEHRGLTGPALGFALHALLLGEDVLSVEVEGVRAGFVPSNSTFFFDHDLIDQLEFQSVGVKPGYCFLIPHAESQTGTSKAAMESRGMVEVLAHDVDVPEHQRIADLIRKVYQQLPTAPHNIVAIGLESGFDLDDVEPALNGEWITDGEKLGGVFVDDTFSTIAGALAFTLEPPSTTGEHACQQARYFPNKRSAQPGDDVVERLVTGLVGRL